MKKKNPEQDTTPIKFSSKSLKIFIGSLISLLIGFVLLIKGDITFAPIFLVLGYVILIPLAILKK